MSIQAKGTRAIMDEDAILRLLEGAQAYDNRNVDDKMIVAWSAAAILGRWTEHEAALAIAEHYAHLNDRIMPGHVTQKIRWARSQPSPVSEVLAISGGRPASDETRRRAMADIAQLHTPETPQQKAARIRAEWALEQEQGLRAAIEPTQAAARAVDLERDVERKVDSVERIGEAAKLAFRPDGAIDRAA